jgi:dihydrodipicolinate synthase/N-acetylneuraminate lyase
MKRYPSCIMSTCCVPWDDRDRFDESIFRRGVRLALAGTPHLYVFGTAGEGYAVTDRQFDEIVTAFADEMRRSGAEPMVGVIHLSLGTIVERIERCRAAGVRRFQISLPSWGALNNRELFCFFDRVCGRFTDCQFLHYNLPRTKRLVTPQEYGRLAASHPNLVATKNSSDSLSFTAELLERAPDLQHFLNETGYLYARLSAECGLLASFVTNWPRLRLLFDAGQRRDLEMIAQLQREIRVYSSLLGFLGDSVHIDGAYDKMFARINDLEFPLRLLPPYSFVSEDQFQQFAAALREQLPQWLPARGNGGSHE